MLATYKLYFDEIDSLFNNGLFDNRIKYVDAINEIKAGFFYNVKRFELLNDLHDNDLCQDFEGPSYDPKFFSGFVNVMISYGWRYKNKVLTISFNDRDITKNKSIAGVLANLNTIDTYITTMRYSDPLKLDYSLKILENWNDLFGEFSN